MLDSSGIIRVGGRQVEFNRPYDRIHPIIVSGRCNITKLIIRAEHIRLLHLTVTSVRHFRWEKGNP